MTGRGEREKSGHKKREAALANQRCFPGCVLEVVLLD